MSKQSEAVEAYERDKENLIKLLGYSDSKNVLGYKGKKVVEDGLDVAFEHLEEIIEGEETQPDQEELDTVKHANRLLLQKITFQPITNWLKDFTHAYTKFMLQWNNKVLRSNQVRTFLMACQRLVDSHETIKDMVEMGARVKNEIEPLLKREPATLNLSRHYLKEIQSEVKEGNYQANEDNSTEESDSTCK